MKYPKQKQRKDLSKFEPVELVEGETIETKCRRLIDTKEPITDGAPILFTERKDGVPPAYDIRTDRWAIAQEASYILVHNICYVRTNRKRWRYFTIPTLLSRGYAADPPSLFASAFLSAFASFSFPFNIKS